MKTRFDSGWIPWIGEPSHFTEMSAHLQRSSGIRRSPGFLPQVSGETHLFDPAMNSSLLEGFNRGRLGVGESGFRAAFGKFHRPLPRVWTSRNSMAPFRTR